MLSPGLTNAPEAQRRPGEWTGEGRPEGSHAPSEPLSLTCTLHLPPQDALLFLKDFFTSLVAGINPMVPAETSTEGERLGRKGEGFSLLLPSHSWAHPWSVPIPSSS